MLESLENTVWAAVSQASQLDLCFWVFWNIENNKSMVLWPLEILSLFHLSNMKLQTAPATLEHVKVSIDV